MNMEQWTMDYERWNNGLWTVEQWTMDYEQCNYERWNNEQRIKNYEQWTMNSDNGPWVVNNGIWTLNKELWTILHISYDARSSFSYVRISHGNCLRFSLPWLQLSSEAPWEYSSYTPIIAIILLARKYYYKHLQVIIVIIGDSIMCNSFRFTF